jgi:SAM-dependent methyltransferase
VTPHRAIFDQDAVLYDAVRPGYPRALVDDVVALARLRRGARILEIGCGTGQATHAFAERGYRIVCVELGANLAEVARRNLAAFADVEIRVGAFEDVDIEAATYDLVLSATAFHWIDPTVGYARAAAALRPGGTLALAWNRHVRTSASAGFFEAVQQIYAREAPQLVATAPLPAAHELADRAPEIVRGGHFVDVVARRYPWTERYSSARYLQLLSTYSGHRTLPPPVRARLLSAIGRFIDEQFGGAIVKGYLTELYVARRA